MRVGVVKLASCSGCVLEVVRALTEAVGHLRGIEVAACSLVLGESRLEGFFDLVLVEGSASTERHVKLLKSLRERAGLLVALGSCAIEGGVQALSNGRVEEAKAAVYPEPGLVESMGGFTPVTEVVSVDLAVPGCPVNYEAVKSLLLKLSQGGLPVEIHESVCAECKRRGLDCLVVSGRAPCLGPLTRSGCGALCPSSNRGCYGCYGLKTGDLGRANVGYYLERLAGAGWPRDQLALYLRAFSKRALRAAGLGEGLE
ncbi:oxidoreductase [Thermogladius sp.]|uniref:NADH-quinone oxidoreductase subunit B family protein n=1 Tax=Thermogladius sp. TaxID=2023064 RepID=UPI003D0D440B